MGHFRIKNNQKLELERKLKTPFSSLMCSIREASKFAQEHEKEAGRTVLVHCLKAGIVKDLVFSKFLCVCVCVCVCVGVCVCARARSAVYDSL